MKKMTIKLRITLYFTLLMTVFAVVMMLYSYYVSKLSATLELRDELETTVKELGATLIFTESRPTPPSQKPEDADISGLPPQKHEGSNTSEPPIQGQQGQWQGQKPDGGEWDREDKKFEWTMTFPEDTAFKLEDTNIYVSFSCNGTVSEHGALHEGINIPSSPSNDDFDTVETENGKYLLYTYFLPASDRGNAGAWLAGTVSTSAVASAAANSLKWVLLALPFVIILAALLGYSVTKRAFRPVSDITAAATRIRTSSSLDERINFKGARDELGVLADTFDGMLDTIEDNFNKEKQFTDNASHELRTPVAVIMAQSELGLDEHATHEDRQEALESINRQAKKMNKLLHVLLSLARADNGRMKLEKEEFDLAELASTVAEEQAIIASERGISITADSNGEVTVNADRMHIIGALMNLVTNAIKYGKDGGHITISVYSENGNAVCKVSDDGIGISEDALPHVWERFYRVSEARTADTTDSMGLGLAIVKSSISAHGGTVDAESVEGVGSTFTFTLPL